MSSLPSDFFFLIDIILVEKIDIYLFKLFVRIYLLLYDCNLMLSDGEYNLLTYLLTYLLTVFEVLKLQSKTLVRTWLQMFIIQLLYSDDLMLYFYIHINVTS